MLRVKMNWYYADDGRARGPVAEQGLRELAHDGNVGADTLVWHPGLEEWQAVRELNPGLLHPRIEAKNLVPAAAEEEKISIPAEQDSKPVAQGFFKRLFGLSKK